MKKFKRVLALILSIVVTATVADFPVTVNAEPPAGETYEDYDVITYADLLDTGNHSLASGGTTLSAQNNLFHYTATSSTHSAIYKFRYVAGADVYFQMFPGAYRSNDPFAYRIKNATTYEKRYAPNAATQAVGHTIVEDEIIDFEIGRLMVATGTNAGNYYTYLKANDTLIFEGYATSSQISGTDLDDSIQLNLNGSNSCTITETPAPEPETFCDYDEVTYWDMLDYSSSNALSSSGTDIGAAQKLKYNVTSATHSAIVKFRWTAGTTPRFAFYFDAWAGSAYPFCFVVKNPGYDGLGKAAGENGAWHVAPDKDSTIVQMDTPIVPGNSYDIEFARLKVATGPNTGKYYVYLNVDGEQIYSYYLATVNNDGTYTGGSSAGSFTEQLRFNSSEAGNIISATPEPVTYYDYDEVMYYDLLSGGNALAEEVYSKDVAYTYNQTSDTGSAILKFRLKAVTGMNMQIGFDTLGSSGFEYMFGVQIYSPTSTYANGYIWLRPGYSESTKAGLPTALTTGNTYDIEFARLKVKTGPNKNKYYIYFKMDGELVAEDYVAANVVNGSGNYTSNPGSVSCTISNKVYFNVWGDSSGSRITYTPEVERYYDYDTVTYYDMRSNGNALPEAGIDLGTNRTLTYTVTSETHSAVLKYRWTAGATAKYVFYFDAWAGSAYPFCLAVKNPGYADLGAAAGANGAWHIDPSNNSTIVQMDTPIVAGNSYDIEYGRLKVVNGFHRNQYYVFLKVDGELVSSYYYSGVAADGSSYKNGTGTFNNQLLFNSSYAGNVISPIPIPVTYEDYDEIGYDDLTLNGDPVSDTGTNMSGATVFNYTPTSPTGSAVFKYRWKVGSSANFQMSFEKTSATAMEYMFGAWLYAPESGHPNGHLWLRPSYGPQVELASALATGSKHNVEFGRLKIKTGSPAVVGKYYLYIKIDDVLIAEDYVAADVVDASGNYTSNPGSTACNVNTGEIIFTFWGSEHNVVSAYKEPLPNGHQGISGDFDDDGIVNSGDVILLRKILVGTLGLSELPAGIADFNSDGSVNLLDLIELKLYLAHTTSDTYSRSSALVLGTQEHLLEDETKTAAYIADASATLGADAYRLSMPIRNLYYATSSNGVGVYSDKMAELKSMVAALKAQGIDKILYVSDCFLLPYDYYNGTTNHANTVPDPTTDPENYLDWLTVNAAAFGALAAEVPEIKYFEPYNEINLSDKRIEKPGIPWDASAAQQASHKYTVDEKARIMADICWHISKAVKAVDSRNQVTTPSISVADASIVQNTFLDALYDAIESGGYPAGHTVGDVNVDNYFTIVNLHLYPEFTDNNPATKINAFASRLNSAYSIMKSHKDGGAPVWLTETGVSSYHGDGAPRNETTAGGILTLALSKINTDLTFIDTVFIYKIADISTSVGQTLCESGYGLFYSGDASSNRYVAKPTAKAVYSFFNGGTSDYSALTALANRYN